MVFGILPSEITAIVSVSMDATMGSSITPSASSLSSAENRLHHRRARNFT